jgi:nitroreductase
MDVSETILRRCSIRKWKDQGVQKEVLLRVLDAGRRAPSWANVQPWRFVIVQDKKKLEGLASAAGGQATVSSAPVVIVACAVPNDFSKSAERRAIKELIDTGAVPWLTEEILDNVLLKDEVHSPHLLGKEVMTMRAREQVNIALAYMTLEAVNQGLGSLWVGSIKIQEVREALAIPIDVVPHAYLVLGYADEEPSPRPRKALDSVLFWEAYGTQLVK